MAKDSKDMKKADLFRISEEQRVLSEQFHELTKPIVDKVARHAMLYGVAAVTLGGVDENGLPIIELVFPVPDLGEPPEKLDKT